LPAIAGLLVTFMFAIFIREKLTRKTANTNVKSSLSSLFSNRTQCGPQNKPPVLNMLCGRRGCWYAGYISKQNMPFWKGATKTREWKTRHQTAGVENAGITSMESQNFRYLTLLQVGYNSQ